MISYFENGVRDTRAAGEISFDNLVSIILNHPRKEQIQQLRTIKYGSPEYKRIKEQLPCITPHGTFQPSRKKEHLQQFSGYFYFDIDAVDIPGDVEQFREDILSRYSGKIALLGKSVGGHGLFFYCRLAHPEIITQDNFDIIHSYLLTAVFPEIPVDSHALGIARPHIIPYDEELYVNKEAVIHVPEELIEERKGLNRCKREVCCTATDTFSFLPIKDVLSQINFTTPVDIGNNDVIAEDILCHKVFVPKVIPDGSKHTSYRGMVNALMRNNPDIELLVILSFINFINETRTNDFPMRRKEMIRMVTNEFERIKETGEVKGGKIKRYHTNPKYSKEKRISLASKKRWEEYREKTLKSLQEAVQRLQSQNVKVTQKNVAKPLDGKPALITIKRYWHMIMPKRIV